MIAISLLKKSNEIKIKSRTPLPWLKNHWTQGRRGQYGCQPKQQTSTAPQTDARSNYTQIQNNTMQLGSRKHTDHSQWADRTARERGLATSPIRRLRNTKLLTRHTQACIFPCFTQTYIQKNSKFIEQELISSIKQSSYLLREHRSSHL